MPVPAVPDSEAIEADEALDAGKAREQQHLEQRGVGAQKPRDPAEARQELAGAVDVGDVAAVHPEPDDQDSVSADHRPQRRGRKGARVRSRATPGGEGRGPFEGISRFSHAQERTSAL